MNNHDEKQQPMQTPTTNGHRIIEADDNSYQHPSELYKVTRRDRGVLSNIGKREAVRPDTPNVYAVKSLSERVADLEIRVLKLWDLLIEKSLYTKQEKLTKKGKEFAGVLWYKK